MAALLLIAMALGSLALWIAIPAGWFWLAGRLTGDYPSIYLLVLATCPLTMIAFAMVLSRLNRAYYDLKGRGMPEQTRSAWLKSLSAERGRRRERTVLEAFMTASATLAFVALLVWLFAFAGSPLEGRI